MSQPKIINLDALKLLVKTAITKLPLDEERTEWVWTKLDNQGRLALYLLPFTGTLEQLETLIEKKKDYIETLDNISGTLGKHLCSHNGSMYLGKIDNFENNIMYPPAVLDALITCIAFERICFKELKGSPNIQLFDDMKCIHSFELNLKKRNFKPREHEAEPISENDVEQVANLDA